MCKDLTVPARGGGRGTGQRTGRGGGGGLTARRLLAGLRLGEQGGESVYNRAEAIVNRPLDEGGDSGLEFVERGGRRHLCGGVTVSRSTLCKEECYLRRQDNQLNATWCAHAFSLRMLGQGPHRP